MARAICHVDCLNRPQTTANDQMIVPPFAGVKLVEFRDRIELTPHYWCREFIGVGNFELALNWLRGKYNLLSAEELSAVIRKATGKRVQPATIKKRRERLGLTTARRPGPHTKI